jgi:hypothetical protein
VPYDLVRVIGYIAAGARALRRRALADRHLGWHAFANAGTLLIAGLPGPGRDLLDGRIAEVGLEVVLGDDDVRQRFFSAAWALRWELTSSTSKPSRL